MKNNNFKTIFSILLAITIITLNSCKPEDNDPKNESEVITTLHIALTDSVTGLVSGIFTFADPDGDGGNNPTINDSIILNANKTYFAELIFLDQTKNPIDTISKEIFEEGDEHQLFYNLSNENISVGYDDLDVNGDPIGLKTKWNTGLPSNSTLNIILKHQPENTKNGSSSSGDTDFEHTFNVRIM